MEDLRQEDGSRRTARELGADDNLHAIGAALIPPLGAVKAAS